MSGLGKTYFDFQDDFVKADDEFKNMISSGQYNYLVLLKSDYPGNEGFWINTRKDIGDYDWLDIIIKEYNKADIRDKRINEILDGI